MATALESFIQESPMADTHEHFMRREELLASRPDIIEILFGHYQSHDMATADASLSAGNWGPTFLDAAAHSFEERYAQIAKGLEYSRHTSYMRAARHALHAMWGIEDLSLPSLQQAQSQLEQFWHEGMRLEIMRDKAGLDHIQSDNFDLKVEADSEASDFFLYDLSITEITNLQESSDLAGLGKATGHPIEHFDGLGDAIGTVFEMGGARAIAVKSAHAYTRSLQWTQRARSEAKGAFERMSGQATSASLEDRLCLSDWILERCIEEAMRHDLPVKIHTGYYAGNYQMRAERIRPGHLCSLLDTFRDARFVLMHMGYPYQHEMLAVAKHFPNAYVDLCWAWSISETACGQFLKDFLDTVPYNKLFAFGGDTMNPFMALGYSIQARNGISKALQELVAEKCLSEAEAIRVAEHIMLRNQYSCFDLGATRKALENEIA